MQDKVKGAHTYLDTIKYGFILLLVIAEIFLTFISIFTDEGFPILGKHIDPIDASNISICILSVLIAYLIGVLGQDSNNLINIRGLLSEYLSGQNTCRRGEYEATIKQLLKESKNEIFLVLRTGKILKDCQKEFEDCLKRGCSIKVILLDKNYYFNKPSQLRTIVQEGESSIQQVMEKFRDGDLALQHLVRYIQNNNVKGSFEFETNRNLYVPSQLVFLSDSEKTAGSLFRVSLFFGFNPRKSSNILTTKNQDLKLFYEYKSSINDLWKYLENKSFDSSLSEDRIVIDIPNVLAITDSQKSKIYKVFRRFGFVLIRPSETHHGFEEEILYIGKLFGSIIFHERSNEQGISKIKLEKGKEEFFGTTNQETGLHTDGTYMEEPPKVVIHQCVNPASKDGKTLLVSCKNIYDEIIEDSRKNYDILKCPNDVYTISRAKQSYTRSVFCDCKKSGRIEVAFRAGEPATIEWSSEKSKKAFNKFEIISHNQSNIFSIRLRSYDILVIDNTSVLHGREEFPEGDTNRELNRLFLDGNITEADELLNLGFLTD